MGVGDGERRERESGGLFASSKSPAVLVIHLFPAAGRLLASIKSTSKSTLPSSFLPSVLVSAANSRQSKQTKKREEKESKI